MNYNNINNIEIKDLIKRALQEDIGTKDITSELIIPKNKFIRAAILAKEDCVVCGLGVISEVFKTLDKNIKLKRLCSEGDFIKKGGIIAIVSGNARSILTAERVALNFLGLLCGISTKTRKFVNVVKPYKTKILDTRKTIPGLRLLEKYAVRIGGGYNHRLSLDEMILVKDNHLKIIGGINKITHFSSRYKSEIEVKSLKEFKDALRLKPDIIMLDNMRISDIKRAVKFKNSLSKSHHKKPMLEASGGITLKNVKKIASTGVDMISVGNLTHSVKSIDISLEVL